MKRKAFLIIATVVMVISGCGKIQEKENISDAYEKVENADIAVREESTDKEEKTTEMEIKTDALPAKKTSSESMIVGAYDEVEYSGIKFQIEKVAKSDGIDVIYDVMDNKSQADEFREQVLDYAAGWFKDGKTNTPQFSEIIAIKCKMTNTTDEERRISMEPPLYRMSGDVNPEELQKGSNFDISVFSPASSCLDFYGEHYEYIMPGVGMKTQDSSQYHMLKAGETFETVMVFSADTIYYGPDTKWFISSYFLGGATDVMELYLPEGTHLIPLQLD